MEQSLVHHHGAESFTWDLKETFVIEETSRHLSVCLIQSSKLNLFPCKHSSHLQVLAFWSNQPQRWMQQQSLSRRDRAAVVLTSQGRRWMEHLFTCGHFCLLLRESNLDGLRLQFDRKLEANLFFSLVFAFSSIFCFDRKTLRVFYLHCFRFFFFRSSSQKLDSSLLSFFRSKICSGSFLKCAYFRFQCRLKILSQPLQQSRSDLIQSVFIERFRSKFWRHRNSIASLKKLGANFRWWLGWACAELCLQS